MYPQTIIFLCVIVFLVGMAAGSFIEGLLKKRTPPPPTPPPVPPPPIDRLAQEGDVKIFSAWRTNLNRVWLEMDDSRLEDSQAMQPGQRQRLLDLVLELRPWLETTRPQSPAPVAASPVAPPLSPLPKLKKITAVADEVAPPPVMETIIQQIDRILQARLATSPFKGRGIQLIEGPGGIVLVRDGVNRYEGIAAVPDPEVKALIQQAVAEWEQKAP